MKTKYIPDGDRWGTIADPFGDKWTIATHKEDVSPEEVRKRAAAMIGNPRIDRPTLTAPTGR